MKRTTNYSLPTWEKSDFIQMSDFNDLTQKTDAALKANADAAGGKADGAATSAALAALTKNLGTAGHNCRIAFGEYTGTGSTGAGYANSLDFGFYPVMVFIAEEVTISGEDENPYVFIRPRTIATSPEVNTSGRGIVNITWTDTGLNWYVTTGKPRHQFNVSGKTYLYAVIGYDKAAEDAQ